MHIVAIVDVKHSYAPISVVPNSNSTMARTGVSGLHVAMQASKMAPAGNTNLTTQCIFFFDTPAGISPSVMPALTTDDAQPDHIEPCPCEYNAATICGQISANA